MKSDHLGKRLRFYAEIYNAVRSFEIIEYAVISGGFVKNTKRRNDVDIITVLPYISSHTERETIHFAIEHVVTQLRNGFHPDFDFPTDIISRQQISDAVQGRAIIVQDGLLVMKNYTNEEIISDPESDYRVWLYEMITHDFDIIDGNFNSLVKDTMIALRTSFLYTVSQLKYSGSITLEQLQKDIFSVAGLEYRLNEKQCRYLLIVIEAEKYGVMDTDGVIRLNHNVINTALDMLKVTIFSRATHAGVHHVEWDTLRKAVKVGTKK